MIVNRRRGMPTEMTERHRQEVLNVLLAQLLQERGVISAPEQILDVSTIPRRKMPDVLVSYRGLRMLIEGEVDDQPDAKGRALEAARKRVTDGIAHMGVAVVYPAELRTTEFDRLKPALAAAKLLVAISTESGDTAFSEGDADFLETALRHAFDQLLREDIITRAAAMLHSGIEWFARTCAPKFGIIGKMARVLGIPEVPGEGIGEAGRRIFPEREAVAVGRVGALVVLNAMIFQEVLADDRSDVKHLTDFFPVARFQHCKMCDNFCEHWDYIYTYINYYPIFHVAREIIRAQGSYRYSLEAVEKLAQTAHEIVTMRVPLRHDLMGRVYHRLLADAKFLGTYYTSIPAAALLLKLALRPNAWPQQWHDLSHIGKLRIADLACGTGTLLMAAADAITDNHISASAREGERIDFENLQKVLAENILFGYDVLPSAIHLTASTLALRAPHIAFDRMNLFSLPMGGPELRLGSVDFLTGRQCQMTLDLFGALPATQQMSAESVREVALAEIPDLDLCVMNPPFTRSVGGNLLFGSVPKKERGLMRGKLQALIRKPRNGVRIFANITAGLGSVFVAVADRYIKPGGRMALVLPKAVLSGVAWEPTRQMLAQKYQLEYIIGSHDPQRWNFSESTDLSEVLVVARKNDGQKSRRAPKVVAINFWQNLSTIFESLTVAQTLSRNDPPDLASGQGTLEISHGGQKLGEAVSVEWKDLKDASNWLLPCAFAQSDLTRVAGHLLRGELWLPGHRKIAKVPLCALSELGLLGPDCRDIHDGFSRSLGVTPYAAFWSHDAEAVYTMAQQPNAHLMPLHKAKEGRNLRKVEDLWPLAGPIVLVERMRLNTQKLTAVRLTEPVLSNTWWPFTPKKRHSSAQRQKALVLWLNSTLGVLLLCVHREETQGAWVKFKKPVLSAMPVLNLASLSQSQLRQLATAYDRLSDRALLPLPLMTSDDVRAEIDMAIAKALRLPDFSILREMLAREPVVCLRSL